MHSIRFKITAVTILALLATVVVVSFASFSAIQADSNRSSVSTMSLIAHDTKHSIEAYTESIEQAADMIANVASGTLDSVELVKGGVAGSDAWLSMSDEAQKDRLDSYLGEYCKAVQRMCTPIAKHTHGIVGYYYCISSYVSETEHGFFYSNTGKTGFVEQEPLNACLLDSDDMAHTMWYFKAIERGRPSWIGPYKDSTQGDIWVCSYVVPVYSAGVLVGVVGMDIPIDTLIEQVSSIVIYDTGFACLLGENGEVVYHPELEFGSELDVDIDDEVLKRGDSGDAMIRYVKNGQERQLSFTELSNGMKLFTVAPVDEINATSTRLFSIIVSIFVVIAIIVAIAMSLLLRYLTNPLQKLTEASKQLADSNYDVELDYDGKDEVGALTNAFQRMRDQMKDYIEDLNRRAHTDDLTGLSNQRFFYDHATAEMQRLCAEGKKPVAVYVNIIGMKHYNQRYGFERGDALICEVADVLAHMFGEENTSRFSQDHFAVVTDGDCLNERLRKVFAECRTLDGGKSVPVVAGIYQESLGHVDASTAFDRAKQACDYMRGTYVSGYRYFDEQMLEQATLVRHVIDHFDQALEEGWVTVFYQPIIRTINGRVCDEEALSRWIDPERGFLSPADFIPALENSGLIYKLDLYVLDLVLLKMVEQQSRGLTVVPHSINLSRSDFDSCDIVDEICKRVDNAGISRDMITIEITESIIGSDFNFMKQQVERFQRLGFPVWMDDFGSGYSSLDVLQSIRFDLIKFDMSFMRKLDEGTEGKIILRELMRMANALGVDTVCEGVETEEQRRFLQEIGCSKLQGYFFCKPISQSEVYERYDKGIQIGFENPEESEYFERIGKINLYDLSLLSNADDSSFMNAYNTMPMCVVELAGGKARFVRTNQSYRDFTRRVFGEEGVERVASNEYLVLDEGDVFARAMLDCQDGAIAPLYDGKTLDGLSVHFTVRHVQDNPVNGATAILLAILSVAGESSSEDLDTTGGDDAWAGA